MQFRVLSRREQLHDGRIALGWTQLQMAEALGVSANTVARWERGEIPISLSRILAIQQVLMTNPDASFVQCCKRGRVVGAAYDED